MIYESMDGDQDDQHVDEETEEIHDQEISPNH